MTGIAGILGKGKQQEVSRMLETISYRGQAKAVIDTGSATMGITWSPLQIVASISMEGSKITWDDEFSSQLVLGSPNGLILKRDPLGIVPLYYGKTDNGSICFASEVKSLLEFTSDVHELQPGYTFDGIITSPTYQLRKLSPLKQPPQVIANELRRRLERAVEKRTIYGKVGAWLSGGLDSSALAALARRHVHPFHTFTAGLPNAPDVKFARIVAEHIDSEHHEVIVQLKDLIALLPDVIYHLESFDAWLVRSSIMNYLVAKISADYVSAVFSGEGGDELFAGYEYLKALDPADLPDELIDIILRLHNTALQRVDRSAAAHGIVAHVTFLEPEVLDYALRIPVKYKLYNGIEKWILRQALADLLPVSVLGRRKAKFWQGAGVEELLEEYAAKNISESDFAKERKLDNGWLLNTKEELLYYRIFQEHFGKLNNLQWMGRTKGAPKQE